MRSRAALPLTHAGNEEGLMPLPATGHGPRVSVLGFGNLGAKGRSNISFMLANRHCQQSRDRSRGKEEGFVP